MAGPGKPGWLVDSRNGCWVWSLSEQPGTTVRWSGACPRGPSSGQGTAEWQWQEGGQARKLGYTGQMREGRRNGRGTVIWSDGGRYDGDWRDGVQHGRGVETFASGSRYEGEWLDDLKHGRGVLITATGARYDGEWRGDRRDGRGIETWPDGARFEGEYRGDRPDGYGQYFDTATEWFRGVWVGGCLTRDDGRVMAIGRPLSECC